MSVALKRNIDAYLYGVNAFDTLTVTAGGAADGVLQNGVTINRGDLVQDALSASVLLHLAVDVNAGVETASVVVSYEDSADGTAWAAYGTAGAAVTYDADGSFIQKEALNLAGARQYVRVNVTVTCSAGATDTVAVTGIMVQSGFNELPVAVDTSGDSF